MLFYAGQGFPRRAQASTCGETERRCEAGLQNTIAVSIITALHSPVFRKKTILTRKSHYKPFESTPVSSNHREVRGGPSLIGSSGSCSASPCPALGTQWSPSPRLNLPTATAATSLPAFFQLRAEDSQVKTFLCSTSVHQQAPLRLFPRQLHGRALRILPPAATAHIH